MRYRCVLKGKEYEFTVEKIDDFEPMTYEEVATGVVKAPAKPAEQSALGPAAVEKKSKGTAPQAKKTGAGEAAVTAPLPGTILSIAVKEGQSVTAGELILTMEAMKLETEVVAKRDGIVKKINVAKGAAVDSGDVLAEIG